MLLLGEIVARDPSFAAESSSLNVANGTWLRVAPELKGSTTSVSLVGASFVEATDPHPQHVSNGTWSFGRRHHADVASPSASSLVVVLDISGASAQDTSNLDQCTGVLAPVDCAPLNVFCVSRACFARGLVPQNLSNIIRAVGTMATVGRPMTSVASLLYRARAPLPSPTGHLEFFMGPVLCENDGPANCSFFCLCNNCGPHPADGTGHGECFPSASRANVFARALASRSFCGGTVPNDGSPTAERDERGLNAACVRFSRSFSARHGSSCWSRWY